MQIGGIEKRRRPLFPLFPPLPSPGSLADEVSVSVRTCVCDSIPLSEPHDAFLVGFFFPSRQFTFGEFFCCVIFFTFFFSLFPMPSFTRHLCHFYGSPLPWGRGRGGKVRLGKMDGCMYCVCVCVYCGGGCDISSCTPYVGTACCYSTT